jgi:hypothetical protein
MTRAFPRILTMRAQRVRGTVAAAASCSTQPAGCVGGLKGAYWMRPASQLSDYNPFSE